MKDVRTKSQNMTPTASLQNFRTGSTPFAHADTLSFCRKNRLPLVRKIFTMDKPPPSDRGRLS